VYRIEVLEPDPGDRLAAEQTVHHLERVTLDEGERVPRLRREVDTDDLEARAVVADRASSGA
jgi:hypothetical protein